MLMRFCSKLVRWPKNKLTLITGSLLTSRLQKYKHCNQPLLQNLDEIISQFLQFLIWLWVKEHIIWDEESDMLGNLPDLGYNSYK